MSNSLVLTAPKPAELALPPTIEQMPGESEQQYFWAVKYWELGKGDLPVYWISQAPETERAEMRAAAGTFKWFERYRLYRAYMAEQRRELLLTATQEAADLLVPVLAIAKRRLDQADPDEEADPEERGISDWDIRAGTFTKLLSTLGQLTKATADTGIKLNVDNSNRTAVLNGMGGKENPDASAAGIAWGMPPTARQREESIATSDTIEGEFSEKSLDAGNEDLTVE